MLLKNVIKIAFVMALASTVTCDIYQDKIQRKLKLHLNPGCPESICDEQKVNLVNVAHVTADSATDRLHHVWSFVGKPTLLVALSALNSTLSIDWSDFMGFTNATERNVKIMPEPEFVMIVVLDRIYQFNDPLDTGLFDNVPDKNIVTFDTSMFTYTFNKSEDRPDFAQLAVHATKYNTSNVGAVTFNVQTYGNFDHGWNFPHLLHNSNGTQMDIVFDHFKTRKAFKGPRLAVELAFMTSDPKGENSSFVITKRRTLDDEHTPGIFEIDNLQAPSSYFEYRPVSYMHAERDVTTSTDTHLGPLIVPSVTWYMSSLAFSYFGYRTDYLVQAANISFGVTNDGFYTKTNYTSFTFLMGIGVPPTEELSKFVVTIALVGVGIPIIFLFVGITCICVKRVRSYRRLDEQ